MLCSVTEVKSHHGGVLSCLMMIKHKRNKEEYACDKGIIEFSHRTRLEYVSPLSV